jgi:hypothetical protein
MEVLRIKTKNFHPDSMPLEENLKNMKRACHPIDRYVRL